MTGAWVYHPNEPHPGRPQVCISEKMLQGVKLELNTLLPLLCESYFNDDLSISSQLLHPCLDSDALSQTLPLMLIT